MLAAQIGFTVELMYSEFESLGKLKGDFFPLILARLDCMPKIGRVISVVHHEE